MTPVEIQQRLSICDGCEHIKKVELLNRINVVCAMCGCFLSAKTRQPSATCPKDKWPKLNP